MHPKSRAFRPGAAALEPRVLLSAAEVSRSAFARSLTSASVDGRYQAGQDRRAADAPLQVKVNGVGTMDGKARMVGNLRFGGFRMANSPDITGSMTLSDAKGTIKLQVTGTGGNSKLPGNRFALNAVVVRGTGAYANAQGFGSATLSFGASAVKGKAAGPATLRLDLDAPIR